jgi:MoaA/NifB/PqqE/SkfB family radical SAM enzyme
MDKLPDVLISRKKGHRVILCFSIIVTGRCNASCSYCHFFAKRDRQKIGYDISDELFDTYILLISKIKKILPPNIELQCRFSGGEPLVLGKRLFDLANKLYQTTHIKPYILTNGKAINESFIRKARKSSISFLYVSLENPLEPDKGAPDPYEIMNKIAKYNSEKLPIIPAVVIIKNTHFKNLYKICKIFYKKLESLPTISELNYQLFTSPTKVQLKDLYKNVLRTVKYFHLRTAIRFFPYISPELCYGGYSHYLIELDLENKHKLTRDNISRKLPRVLNQLDISYPKLNCKNTDCDWYNECKRVKWLWVNSYGGVDVEEKKKSYCEMKKTINNAFYEALKHFE